MFKKQLNANIEKLDEQIGKLSSELETMKDTEEYDKIIDKLNKLTKLRCDLADSKTKASVKPAIVSGLLSVASIAVVLKYEEANVITSKAFEMAKGVVRGSK